MNFKCNLIIDSCCDLPFDLVDRQGVQLVKFPYFFDGIETLDDLWQSSAVSPSIDEILLGRERFRIILK